MFYLWISAAVCLLAYSAWRGADHRSVSVLLAGLMATRVIAELPFEARMMAGAAIWCGIGAWLIRRAISPLAGALLVACGLCYLWARLAYSPVAIGSAPFVASDVFGALALCVMAWEAHHGGKRLAMGAYRGRVLGWAIARRRDSAGGSMAHTAQEEGR